MARPIIRQIVLARWLAGLNEAANTSALHKLAVKRPLEGSIVGLPKGSGTPPALLTDLYELVVECTDRPAQLRKALPKARSYQLYR
jgi:hypothetical protein